MVMQTWGETHAMRASETIPQTCVQHAFNDIDIRTVMTFKVWDFRSDHKNRHSGKFQTLRLCQWIFLFSIRRFQSGIAAIKRLQNLFSSRSNGHDGNPSNKLLGCWSAHCLRCSGFSRLARIEKDNVAFFDLMEDYFNQPLVNLRKDERSSTSKLLSRLHGMGSIGDARMPSQKTPPRMRTHSTHLNYQFFWYMNEKRPHETRPEFPALRLT